MRKIASETPLVKKTTTTTILSKLLTLSLITLTLSPPVTPSQLDCTFKSNAWNIYDYDRLVMNQTDVIRYCEVKNKEIFTNFVRIEGILNAGSEDLKNVNGISFAQGTLNFFPHGIEGIFPKITAITAEEAKLREIHVEDLAPFKHLKLLYLNGNELRVIEADLFKFNGELELIRLDFNQISHVDSMVFSHLVNLKFLWMNGNKCQGVVGNAIGNREEVLKITKQIEDEKCSNPEELKVISNSHDRIMRILDELEDLRSINPDDQILVFDNKNLKSENLKLSEEIKVFEEKNSKLTEKSENLAQKIQNLENKNKNLELKITELQMEGSDCTQELKDLKTCQSDLTIKQQEIERLNKVIEQLQNAPSDNKKIPWRTILIPSVISLLILIVLIVGIVVIIVKLNFIIQKLKDQFYNTRRPINVPNDFWHHEE